MEERGKNEWDSEKETGIGVLKITNKQCFGFVLDYPGRKG